MGKTLFVKWFIITAATLAASYISWSTGLVDIIVKNDMSRLSIVMTVLYGAFCYLSGCLSYQIDKHGHGKVNYKRSLRILNFLSDKFFTLGLLGTIVGFCFMMYGTLNTGIDVNQIIAQLKVGVSTALYTTLVGMIYSLIGQLQIFVIEHHLKYE